MKSYSIFAEFYDSLTRNVNYKKRADYICKIVNHFNHDFGICLDLACGTGNLTLELANRGVDIYGIDASSEMLMQAQNKAYDMGLNILFLCQKMQNIDLYGTIDTCICTLDSINHLTKREDVQNTFNKISLFMNKGGLFIFDVNSVYKNQKILANNTYVYDTKEVYCVWQNSLKDDTLVNIELDFFIPENSFYNRHREAFCERAYTHNQIKEMLRVSGFEIIAYYGDMGFEKPMQTEQRIVYTAKKL